MELIIAIVVALIVIGILFKLAKGAIKLVGIVIVVALLVWFITSMGGTV